MWKADTFIHKSSTSNKQQTKAVRNWKYYQKNGPIKIPLQKTKVVLDFKHTDLELRQIQLHKINWNLQINSFFFASIQNCVQCKHDLFNLILFFLFLYKTHYSFLIKFILPSSKNWAYHSEWNRIILFTIIWPHFNIVLL